MQKQPNLTPQQLAQHLKLVQVTPREERDELLTDLLCHVYRTRAAQNG